MKTKVLLFLFTILFVSFKAYSIPTLSVNGSSTATICLNDQVTLTAASITCTLIDYYQQSTDGGLNWTKTDPTGALLCSNTVIPGPNPGTYMFRFKYSGNYSNTVTVLVQALPIPTISGLDVVCAGTTDVVYSTEGSKQEYDWIVSDGGTITDGGGSIDNTVTVTWNDAGLQAVGVKYKEPATGCTAQNYSAFFVEVNPRPTSVISGSTSICNGQTAHLTIDLTGTGPWTVVVNGETIVINTSPYTYDVTPTSDVTYSISSVTDANGCVAQAGEMTGFADVTVYDRPTGSISGTFTSCTGDPVTLTIEVTGTGPWSGTLSDGTPFSGPSNPISVDVSPSIYTTFTIATLQDANCAATLADLSGSATVYAGAPVSRLNSVTVCDGQQIDVPVSVHALENVGAISLKLLFSSSFLSFTGVTYNNIPLDWNPGVPVTGFVVGEYAPGILKAAGSGPAFSLLPADSVLFTLHFSYVGAPAGGTSNLLWDDSDGSSCEYTPFLPPDFNPYCDIPTAMFYKDGVVTVKPLPTLTSSLSGGTICSGSTFNYSPTSSLPATTFEWTRATVAGILEPGTSGTGDPAEVLTNTTSGHLDVTYVYTLTANGCTNPATYSIVVTVNPIPTIDPIGLQEVCNNNYTTTISFTGTGTTYDWTNDNPTIGINGTGSGDILSFLAINSGTVPVEAHIIVTPKYTYNSVTCTGTPINFTIIVYPTPTLTGTLLPAPICSGTTFHYTPASSTVGTTFAWTRDFQAGILPAGPTSGIDDPAETLTNTTGSPINVTYHYTLAADGCSNAQDVVVAVIPIPSINGVSDQVVCNNTSTTTVNFTGVATVYEWTNDNTTIGLGLSGTGSILSFVATNSGLEPVIATITVTPKYTYNSVTCTGTPISFTITVNPTPTLTSELVASTCSGTVFHYTPTSGTTGTTFGWTRATVAGITPTGPTSGTGDPSETLVNTTASPINVTYVYTLTANGCTNPSTYNLVVTVNPMPTMTSGLNAGAMCSGATFHYTPTSGTAGTTFSWTRLFQPGITPAGPTSGSGDPGETLNNTTANGINVSYIYTLTANGCTNPTTYTVVVRVNPLPVLTSSLTPPAICSNSMFSYTPLSSTAGTVFSWTRAVIVGISNPASSGTGNPNEVLVNTSADIIPVTYVYSLSANGCTNPTTFNVVVNVKPIPALTSTLTPEAICSGTLFSYTPTSGTAGTTFTWSRPAVSGISNPASFGSGNINETLINTTVNPVNVTYLYTLSANGCSNPNVYNVVVTVNPIPVLTSTLSPAAICSGSTFNYTPTSATPGTTFDWVRPAVAGITPVGPTTGTGNPAEVLTNTTLNVISVTYEYTLTANGCSHVQNVVVLVYPRPTVVVSGDTTICYSENSGGPPPLPGEHGQGGDVGLVTVTFTFTGTAPWTLTYTDGTTPVTISGITTNPFTISVNPATTSTYTATALTDANCAAMNEDMTGSAVVTVNPIPVVNTVADQVVCNGANTTDINFTGTATSYEWTNDNTTIGLGSNGTGDILSFVAQNSGIAAVVANITVTPVYTFNGVTCTGEAKSFTITVNPTPSLTSTLTPPEICSNSLFTYTPTSATTGTTFAWTRAAIPGISNPPASGTDGISEILNNTTLLPIDVIYTYTLTANGCSNIQEVVVTVTPLPTTVYVDPAYNSSTPGWQCDRFSTIQSGVDRLELGLGGTVNVAAGEYPEQITIHKDIIVNGAGINQTIVKAPLTRVNCVSGITGVGTNWMSDYILAAYPLDWDGTQATGTPINVKITGITFDAQESVHNCDRFSGVFFGSVKGSSYTDAGLFGSAVINFNTGDPSATGVRILGNSKLAVQNCNIEYTINGIAAYGDLSTASDPDVLMDNNEMICTKPALAWIEYALNVCFGATGTISNNIVTDPATDGVLVSSSSNVIITGNTISNQMGNGIIIYNSDNCLITKNTISNVHSGSTGTPGDCGWGIGFDGTSSNNSVGDGSLANANDISGCDAGIIFYGNGSGNTAIGNKIHSNSPHGMNNIGGAVVIATGNWWGSAKGPTVADNPCGDGDALTNEANVSYEPWKDSPVLWNDVYKLTTFNVTGNVTICAGENATISLSGSQNGANYEYRLFRDLIEVPASVTLGNGGTLSWLVIEPLPGTFTYTVNVTNTLNGCTLVMTGSAVITVNPIPVVNPVSNQVICNLGSTTTITFSGTGTSYEWTNDNATIGLGLSGTGNILSFVGLNSGTDPIVAHLSVTPKYTFNGVTCTGSSEYFTITVNPTPTLTSELVASTCSGTVFHYTPTSGTTGTTFGWTRATVAGITPTGPTSGTGDPSETLVNTTVSPINVTYVYTLTANGCTNPSTYNLVVTVNPMPTMTSGLNAGAMCSGTTFHYTPTSGTAGTTFSWTRLFQPGITPAGPTSGSGDPGETLNNTTANGINVTYVYTLTANGCTNPTTYNVVVRVNPLPVLTSSLTPPAMCSNSTFSYTPLSSTAGTVFSWTRAVIVGISNPASSGTGNPNEVLVNTSADIIPVTYVYSLSANGCTNPTTFNVVVNVKPIPALTSTLTPEAICSGTLFSYTPTSGTAGTTFTWSRPAVSGISNPASFGSGNINETLINTTVNPVNVTYLYTLSANGCSNPNVYNVVVTVNPIPVLTSTLSPAAICSGSTFNYTPTSATPGTTFDWVRPAVAGITPVGPTTGTGNPAEVLTNTTLNVISVTYEYTLTANGCSHVQNVVVLVYPRPTVVVSGDTTICYSENSGGPPPLPGEHGQGGDVGLVTVTFTFTGTAPWTLTYTDGTTPVTISGITTNPFTISVNPATTSTYTATALTDANCAAMNEDMTGSAVVTVNPIPVVNTVADQVVCNGANTTDINFTGTATSYEWTNDNTTIGLGSNGTGDILSFVAQNSGIAAVVANITVTPVYTFNGVTCTGEAKSFTITVNPTPSLTSILDPEPICSGSTFHYTPTSDVAGTTFSWSRETIAGITEPGTTGTGDPSEILTNTTTSPIDVTYIYSLNANGCSSPSEYSVVVSVIPIPVVDPVSNLVVCNSEMTPGISFTGTALSYEWTNDQTSIGIDANGTGDILSFTATNSGTDPVVAHLTVTPKYEFGGVICSGTPVNFTITVNPTPELTSTLTPASICNHTVFSYEPTSGTIGTAFAWTRAAVIGISNPSASGSGNPNELLINTTGAPVDVTYVYTLSANGCTNPTTYNVVVTVNESYTITGTLKYNNAAKTPMNNVYMALLNGSDTVATATTNLSGAYTFNYVCNGSYSLAVVRNHKAIGGINSTDAAQANWWSTHYGSIEHVKFLAGDVYGDGIEPNYQINSTDAYRIQYFFVYGTGFDRGPWSYWVAGETIASNFDPHCFDTEIPVDVIGSNKTVNLYGQCTGDFNGTFVPGGAKDASTSLQLVYADTRKVDQGREFELPVYINSPATVGAISVILNFPSDLVEVKDVVIEGSNSPVDWVVNGNELRIGWNSMVPLTLDAKAVLFVLKLKATGSFAAGDDIRFSLASDPLNELADQLTKVIPDAVISIDVLEFSPIGINDHALVKQLTLNNQPNPFDNNTRINYSLPFDGKVTLEICSILGGEIKTLVNEVQMQGNHTLMFDASGLIPGIYTATIRLQGSSDELIRTIKLVRSR